MRGLKFKKMIKNNKTGEMTYYYDAGFDELLKKAKINMKNRTKPSMRSIAKMCGLTVVRGEISGRLYLE
jgi:hypothetical protein